MSLQSTMLYTTEERRDQDSVTTKLSGADDGANSFGPNTMLSPMFNALEFADFPQHDIQIQGDSLSNPFDVKNVNNGLCFDLNGSTDSMANPNLIVAKNGLSEFNRETVVPYAGCPIKVQGAEAKNSRITRLPKPLEGNFDVRGNTINYIHGNILNPAIGGGAEIKSNRNFSTQEIRNKLEEPVSISSNYNSSMVGQSPVNPLNLAPFTGLAVGGQTNGDGLSSPALAGSSRLNTIQFPGLEAQHYAQHYDGANSFGPNTMLSPLSNALDFAEFPQHDIRIQGDSLLNPSDFKNVNNALCFDLNGSTDSMDNPNLKVAKNGMSEFNRESDVPYGGCPINVHGAEAKNSRITSLPNPLEGNFGVRRNTINVHGNILNPATGSGAEVKSNRNFSTREIRSKLEEPVSISSNYNSSMVGQSPVNPLNLAPFTGLAMGGQTKRDGLSSPALTGSSRLNTIQFPGLEAQQANPHSHFSGIYDDFLIDQTPSSSPSEIPLIPQREHVTQSPFHPQISRPTAHASQFEYWRQRYSESSSVSASSEILMNYLSDRQGGSSISHRQLEAMRTQSTSGVRTPGSGGPVGSTSRGVNNACSPPSSVQPVVHLATSHNLSSIAALGNSLSSIPRVNTIHSTAAAAPSTPFPTRLEVHPNYPTARDTPAIHLPAQAYGGRPLLWPGHQRSHGMLSQLPTEYPKPVNFSGVHLPGHAYPIRPIVSSGQVTPVARPTHPQGSVVSHTHLKRGAAENPSSLVSRRRKISPQPDAIRHYAPVPRPSFPASIPSRSHIPPSHVHHIKCQDFDEPLQPSGHKCLLCKSDLKFTAGQVYQDAILPAVAVLPCGHTFHDDCLQKITPEDQLKEPPCIPCALGET